ncbi:MAG: M3 family oligoendopeptidase [Planctomycetota bacterium]|nr:M3 family oligoendopeptidase [Planctomycetota bacterium]
MTGRDFEFLNHGHDMTNKYDPTWELNSLLPHPATDDFSGRLTQIDSDLRKLADTTAVLPVATNASAVVEQWTKVLIAYEKVITQLDDVGSFIGCHAAADAENKLYQQIEARLAALRPYAERISTDIEFGLKECDDDTFERFIDSKPELQAVGFFLRDQRLNAAHRLPKPMEALAADLDVDGIHAWGRLYDRVSSEIRVQVMEHGAIVEKSPSQVSWDSAERTVRQNNYFATDRAWNSIADTCADALNHISGSRLTRYRRLGVSDHLDAPLRHNRLQRKTLDTMWSAVSDRKSVLKSYLDAKARLLGLEQLAWYDLQAPLPARTDTGKISYDDACNLVIDTMGRFSPEFGDFCRRAIQDRWVEAEDRSGKRQGGFCTYLPTARQSRIFMTFTNSQDSMSTLAHELGHAYHSFVLRDQPRLLQSYPMNLAETASTFAEAVLGENRLNVAKTDHEKMVILDGMLADSVGFLMNIHARFLFEDNFHHERASGEVTPDRLRELMSDAQQDAYLDSLAEGGNPNFWISKLHFYISELPFYNFPYTFGYLLSLGMFALAGEDDAFPERYRRLLIATGCHDTETAVQSTFGLDLTEPDFWNTSLDVVARRADEFVKLAEAAVGD